MVQNSFIDFHFSISSRKVKYFDFLFNGLRKSNPVRQNKLAVSKNVGNGIHQMFPLTVVKL